MSEWERVITSDNTQKLKVDGGHLYRTKMIGTEGIGMCFVPDVDLQRYQAHLRDAYKKGYEDGQSDFKNGINGYEKNIP